MKEPKWQDDADDYNIPENLDMFNKAPGEIEAGQRLGWWYKEDEELWEKVEPGDDISRDPPYSGVAFPREDMENNGGTSYSSEDMVIAIDIYPCEKCYPEVHYVAMRRLVDDPTLIKVINIKKDLKKELNKLTDEERHSLFRNYCSGYGSKTLCNC